MKFEDYCKEEFEKINNKIDGNSNKIEQLMIFMAVKRAEDSKQNKHMAMFVGAIVSILVSVATIVIEKHI